MNLSKKDILKYGTFVLFFLTPLVYFGRAVFPYMTSKTFFFYGFANILFFFWLYLIIIDKSYRLSKKQLLLFTPLFLYVLWMTIAGIFATNPHLAFWSSLGRGTGLFTLYYAVTTAIVVSSLVKRNGMQYVVTLLKWFIASAVIVALSVWFGNQGLNIQTPLFVNSSGGGLIGNSSLAGAYLIFAIFLGSFLFFIKTISKKQKIFISSVVAIIIFSPLFVNIYGLFTGQGILGVARGAILGVIVGIGVIILCYFAFAKNKIVKVLCTIGIFLSVIVFSVGWAQLINPTTALHNKFTEVASGTRFIFWDIARKSINKHPYVGYGPENYMIAFHENFNPKILNEGTIRHETWNDRAHNIYYDTGVSGGYPAIMFYFLLIISIVYVLYKLYKKDKISRIQTSVLYGLIVAYVFQNLFVFDSTLSIIIFFTLAGLIYGIDSYENDGINTKSKENERQKEFLKNQSFKMWIQVFCAVPCIVGVIYLGILPARKALVFGNVLAMPVTERPDHYKDFLEGSSVGNDWDIGGFADSTYKAYVIDPMSTKNNKEMLPFFLKDLTLFLEYIEIVAKENPSDFRLYKKMFDLYNTYIFLSDKPSDPVLLKHLFNILDHAKTLSPNNPEIYWGMAQLYAWSGDLKAIEEVYKQAIALDPSVDASHRLLIQFAKTFGNQTLYNEALLRAQKDIPGYIFN